MLQLATPPAGDAPTPPPELELELELPAEGEAGFPPAHAQTRPLPEETEEAHVVVTPVPRPSESIT